MVSPISTLLSEVVMRLFFSYNERNCNNIANLYSAASSDSLIIIIYKVSMLMDHNLDTNAWQSNTVEDYQHTDQNSKGSAKLD